MCIPGVPKGKMLKYGFFLAKTIISYAIETSASWRHVGATHFWALRGDFMLFYPQIGGPWEIA